MLPEALRLIRVFHDVKQNDLAVRFGISKSYLSEIEKGKKSASMDIIDKYSSEFHIPASSILFFAENLDAKNGKSSMSEKARGVIANKVLNFLKVIEARTAKNDDGED